MLMNAGHEACGFHLPGGPARRWRRLVDTEAGMATPDPEERFAALTVDLAPRSLILLETRFHG